MSKKSKEFYKKLKLVQYDHNPPKEERRHKYNWKKEWGPFLKYDADWSGYHLIELIIYKLEKMYLSLDIYSDERREDLDPKLKKLLEIINLGKKIQTYDYHAGFHKWGKIHCAHVILIYKKGHFMKPDSEPIHKIVKWYKEEDLYTDNYLESYFGTEEVKKWASENGYKYKDLEVAYSGEWDDKKNYTIWKQKVTRANNKAQADMDKFFSLISKNIDSWWW